MEHILKWFTGVCDKSQSYLNWFSLTFDPSDFHGIDAVFMCFIKYCAKLNILAKTSYLETYLELDGMKIELQLRTKLQHSYFDEKRLKSPSSALFSTLSDFF